MGMREFTDATGNHWTIWATRPDLYSTLPAPLKDGWLTFECGATRKRLVPIPRDWEEASHERLRLYCAAAEQVAGPRRSMQIDIPREE